MPQMIDITVKKADGTTDITYYKVVPSSGSNSPAIWRSSVGSAPAHKATLRVRSAPNASGTVRRVEGDFVYPETATAADGKITVVNRARVQVIATAPQEMADSLISEAIEQGLNAFASSHFKAMAKEGYSAT